MKRTNDNWSAREQEADAERVGRHRRGTNNPGIKVRWQKKIVTDDIFGLVWLSGKVKQIFKKRSPMVAAFFCCLCMCSCSVTSTTKVGMDGTTSKFFNGAIGGKGGAVKGGQGGEEFVAVFYDNEKSFRDGVIGLATYGVATVIGGAVEAGQIAKTAQHAATTNGAVANAKTAANVANTTTTANLIKDVGAVGEVPISAISLP